MYVDTHRVGPIVSVANTEHYMQGTLSRALHELTHLLLSSRYYHPILEVRKLKFRKVASD